MAGAKGSAKGTTPCLTSLVTADRLARGAKGTTSYLTGSVRAVKHHTQRTHKTKGEKHEYL